MNRSGPSSRRRLHRLLRAARGRHRLLPSPQQFDPANADARKPVQVRRGPATVTGSTSLPSATGRARGREGGREPEARRPLRSRHLQDPRGRVGWGAEWLLTPCSALPERAIVFSAARVRPTLILLALAVTALAACGTDGPPAGGIVVVDDAGDTVTLARPARRIVSLIPAT